jgi:hypothetical protein
MKAGDKVTLQWRGFTQTGTARPLNPVWTVSQTDVGRPLTRLIGRNDVLLIDKGRLELSYKVVYVDGGKDSVSAQQNLKIAPPTQSYLPKPSIDGHGGGPLNPDLFPDGITVRIALYTGARSGDVVTLYTLVANVISAYAAVRIDPSTVDSGLLTLAMDPSWLMVNNGKSAQLFYQYARAGASLTGEPLALLIRTPLDLPVPELDDTKQEPGDEFDQLTMDANDTTSGSLAFVPDGVVIGTDDSVHLHWGLPDVQGHVAIPIAADRKTFNVPKNAIAMHMGAGVGARERLDVYYRVVPSGEPVENYTDSDHIFLKIIPFPQSSFPRIQCKEALGTGGNLSLLQITDPQGATFQLARWAYMHQDQILNIKVVGKENYLLKDYKVVESDVGGTKFSWLSKDFLEQQIGVGNKFKVSVTVSFDGGQTHLAFYDSPELTLTV